MAQTKLGGTDMVRIKCKKCQNVYETGFGDALISPHVGPYHYVKCPACGKRSFANFYSSVKDLITWPPQERQQDTAASELTEEELEQKRIEESKYEKP